MVLTAYVVLSPAADTVSRRRRFRLRVFRNGCRGLSTGLGAHAGHQDHTPSPSAQRRRPRGVQISRYPCGARRPDPTFRAERCRVHRTPPRECDDRETPLPMGRDVVDYKPRYKIVKGS